MLSQFGKGAIGYSSYVPIVTYQVEGFGYVVVIICGYWLASTTEEGHQGRGYETCHPQIPLRYLCFPVHVTLLTTRQLSSSSHPPGRTSHFRPANTSTINIRRVMGRLC